MKKIPKKLFKKIENFLQSSPPKIEWECRDSLSEEYVEKILDGEADEVCEEIFEFNLDYVAELENCAIREIIETFEEEFQKLLEKGEKHFDNEIIFDIVSEEIRGLVFVDLNLKPLFQNTRVEVELVLYSDFDCIEPWFYSSREISYRDSYLGDMIDFLQFNPQEVKKFFKNKGENPNGRWPNYKWREPWVTLEEWYIELINNSSPSLLTFAVTIDLWDFFVNNLNPTKVHLPRGTTFGIFSPFAGGGGVMDGQTIRDIELPLNRSRGDRLFKLGINRGGYSIRDVYGASVARTEAIFE